MTATYTATKYTNDPCAGESACPTPPAEFVRLRYFYGQRLGVVDLADEQSYFAGKQRFHNLRAHGEGVLCGLLAERYVFPQGSAPGTKTTLLRMRRGAALDGCGREIIVGWDQCIDVAAWFAQHPKAAGDVDSGSLKLWVVLCYRECPSEPAPAPRDPCGCDSGGCEFARIREGFELKLLTKSEAEALKPKKEVSLAEWAAEEEDLDDLARITAKCADPPANPCLFLASFQATLDAASKKVVDITGPDNDIPERMTLLPVSILQQGLLAELAVAREAELIGSGPRLSAATFVNGGPDFGTYSISLTTRGSDLSRDPFAAPAQLTVTVFQFKDDGTWVAAPAFTAAYVVGPPDEINIQWASGSGLIDGGRYRAFIESDRTQPPVDKKMRPLTPTSWARHFRLVKNASGNLVLADSLYS